MSSDDTSQEFETQEEFDTDDQQTASDDVSDNPSAEELKAVLGDLRAEVTRLKAQKAKREAQSWVQKRPLLAVLLSSAVGAAAGYGLSQATRSQPPTLSEQARTRIRDLADEARRVASDVGRDLSDRAARSGEQVRARAQETGRRLAQQAQSQGEAARKEAREWARRASDRAREVGSEAGESLRRATQEASDEARTVGRRLAKEAGEAVEKQSEPVRETVEESGSGRVGRSLLAVAGLAVGGYLASKAGDWL